MSDFGIPRAQLTALAAPIIEPWPILVRDDLALLGRAWASEPSFAAAAERRRVYRILLLVYDDLAGFVRE